MPFHALECIIDLKTSRHIFQHVGRVMTFPQYFFSFFLCSSIILFHIFIFIGTCAAHTIEHAGKSNNSTMNQKKLLIYGSCLFPISCYVYTYAKARSILITLIEETLNCVVNEITYRTPARTMTHLKDLTF